MTKQAMEEFLLKASRAIDNGLHDSELAPRLANFGYTAEKLQEGWALYEQASQLYEAQRTAYGKQYSATDDFKAKWEAAQELYIRHVKITRVAFEGERGVFHDLALEGKRPRAFGPWLRAAKQFYSVLLQDEAKRNRLAEYGVTLESLQAGKAAVDAAELAERTQEEARGDAQELTRTRDETFAALEAWLEDYLTVAKIALKDKPQLAEKLGLLVRS